MIVVLKLLLISGLGAIAWQDFRERQVLWFLFPIIALLFAALHYLLAVDWRVFLNQLAINWVLVSCIVSILFIYTKLITKKRFLDHSMGLGDVLFLFAFATGFPTISFVVLLVCSILFSLLAFVIFKRRMESDTVPLAGFMGLFLIVAIGHGLIFNTSLIYGN